MKWPANRDPNDPGVTFLELFTSFRYVTGSLPPINIAPAAWGSPYYLLTAMANLDPAIKLRPQPMHQAIRVFEFSLRYVAKLLEQNVTPIKFIGKSTCLSHLGVKGARGGFVIRPEFPGLEELLQKIADAASNSRGKFVSIDLLEPVNNDNPIKIPICDSDIGRNPWKSYKRFKEIKTTLTESSA